MSGGSNEVVKEAEHMSYTETVRKQSTCPIRRLLGSRAHVLYGDCPQLSSLLIKYIYISAPGESELD